MSTESKPPSLDSTFVTTYEDDLRKRLEDFKASCRAEPAMQVESLGSLLQAPPYPTDCGLDLVTAEAVVLHEGETVNVPCGVRIALPPDTFGWITPRSSTWTKWGLMVIPGIIDEGWRGELFTLVYRPPQPRNAAWSVAVPKGTRLAQLILLPNLLSRTPIVQVESLPPAERGEHGFGSSGV